MVGSAVFVTELESTVRNVPSDVATRAHGREALDEGLFSVIRAARERARYDLTEALGKPDVAQARELLGSDEFDDFEMSFGRLQILAHREAVSYTHLQRAARRRSDDARDAEFLERPGIGEIVDRLRRKAMIFAVPRQKRNLASRDLAQRCLLYTSPT